jgi:hypothetical protein
MVIDIECVVQRAVNGNCSWLAIRSSRLAKIAIPPKGGSYICHRFEIILGFHYVEIAKKAVT